MSELHLNENRSTILVERPPFPRNIMMEVTNACNHACAFCGNKHQKRKIAHADKSFFMRIMDEAYELGAREIGFYMCGEPLLSKDLEDYVINARNIGYEYIYFTTNGALADVERIKKLVEGGVKSIKFSVNAATRDTYKKIHGRDDFDKVYANINKIYQEKSNWSGELSLFITFIRNGDNCGEVDLLHQLFDPIVDKVYVIDENRQAGFNSKLQKLSDITVKDTQWPCVQLFNRIHVTAEGYLDACCIDYDNSNAIEDLHKTSLKDAWHSDRFAKLRREHLDKAETNTRCSYCIRGVVSDDIEPINKELFNS